MKCYQPIYEEAVRPVKGFKCQSTGGRDIEVMLSGTKREIDIKFINDTSSSMHSTWSKSDLGDFIAKLQELHGRMV